MGKALNADSSSIPEPISFKPHRNVAQVTLYQNSYNGSAPMMGWSGGAMVLGKLPVPGRPTILIREGQGPTTLAVGAGGFFLDIFALICSFSPFSPSLWETARYRLNTFSKGR